MYAFVSTESASLLHALRSASGPFRVNRADLSPAERELFGRSFAAHRRAVEAAAARYFIGRLVEVQAAVEWATSEAYTYAIESVIAGLIPIPSSAHDWRRIGKITRRRWWREQKQAAAATDPGQLDQVATWHRWADDNELARLTLPVDRYRALLIRWATVGVESGRLSRAMVATIEAWTIAEPGASPAELARLAGLSGSRADLQRWYMRETRLILALRRGWLIETFPVNL